MTYTLEKTLWTDADFDVMGWHDATLHALAIQADDYRLLLDLDYIFKWVPPVPPEECFSFYVAPVTLVFEGAQALSFNFGCRYIETFQFQGLHRSDPRPTAVDSLTDWAWRLELNEGENSLRAYGINQWVRRTPALSPTTSLSLEDRGGISFGLPDALLPAHHRSA